MTAINIILIIIGTLAFLFYLSKLLLDNKKEKLEITHKILIDSENECLEKYQTKFELINKMIEYTQKKYKIESKAFNLIKEIKIESLDSLKNEKLINKCYKEIMQIREDNPKARESKAFKELIKEYDNNELNIIALRTYHNKYTLIFNNMLKKFPYNFLSKVKKYNLIELLEENETQNIFKNLEV